MMMLLGIPHDHSGNSFQTPPEDTPKTPDGSYIILSFRKSDIDMLSLQPTPL